jgi:O-antigen/teichoic acid export membrane protein
MVPKFRFDILLKSLKIGIPIMLTALLSMLSLSDRFFLEKYYNFETMAVYNLGLALSSIIPIIMTSFQAIYAPIFFKEKDAKKNFHRANKIAVFAIIAFLLVGAGIVVVTQVMILSGIIKKSYSQVMLLLPILLTGSITMALSQLYQNFMVYFEVTHIMLVFFIITNIICVILSMLLVPRFGIYGAAGAVAISGASSLMMHYIFVVKCSQNIRYAR